MPLPSAGFRLDFVRVSPQFRLHFVRPPPRFQVEIRCVFVQAFPGFRLCFVHSSGAYFPEIPTLFRAGDLPPRGQFRRGFVHFPRGPRFRRAAGAPSRFSDIGTFQLHFVVFFFVRTLVLVILCPDCWYGIRAAVSCEACPKEPLWRPCGPPPRSHRRGLRRTSESRNFGSRFPETPHGGKSDFGSFAPAVHEMRSEFWEALPDDAARVKVGLARFPGASSKIAGLLQDGTLHGFSAPRAAPVQDASPAKSGPHCRREHSGSLKTVPLSQETDRKSQKADALCASARSQ